MDADLESIIRPIVEGQIRGFLKEHPSIADAVGWYKPAESRADRARTLIGSLSKRIVRDLCCPSTMGRLVAAHLEFVPEAPSVARVELPAARAEPPLGRSTERGHLLTDQDWAQLGGLGWNPTADTTASPPEGIEKRLERIEAILSSLLIIMMRGREPNEEELAWALERVRIRGLK